MMNPPPTRKDSNIRLVLYIAWTTLSALAAGIQTVDWTSPNQVAGLVVGVLLAAVGAWRAYIDQTPNQIQP